MPDAQAPNPNAIDWQKLIEFFTMLMPLLQSLKQKSEYAKAHSLKDPRESFMAFLDDYLTVNQHQAMASNP